MAKATTADSAQKSDKPVKAAKPGKPSKPAKPNVFVRFTGYLRDVRSEMKRVVWPNRAEVINSSVVVVTTLIFFTVFITLTDLVVQRVVFLIQKIGG
jgi:preprotein translocase subunit SecE